MAAAATVPSRPTAIGTQSQGLSNEERQRSRQRRAPDQRVDRHASASRTCSVSAISSSVSNGFAITRLPRYLIYRLR